MPISQAKASMVHYNYYISSAQIAEQHLRDIANRDTYLAYIYIVSTILSARRSQRQYCVNFNQGIYLSVVTLCN